MLQDAPYREALWLDSVAHDSIGVLGEVPVPEPLPNRDRTQSGGLNLLDSFLSSQLQFARQEGGAESSNTACFTRAAVAASTSITAPAALVQRDRTASSPMVPMQS